MQVHSIFESISGEAGEFPQGSWCTFIRLNGCNLRCAWCDTPGAQGGEYTKLTPKEILRQVRTKRTLITGGEPLMQRNELTELIALLNEHGHTVQVETNGSAAIPVFIHPVSWVVDYKCPSSGMHTKMRELDFLAGNIRDVRITGGTVYIKWVVADKTDVVFAIENMLGLRQIIAHPYLGPHIISPLDADGSWIDEIVDTINRSSAFLLDNVIFSVQLHKIMGMP